MTSGERGAIELVAGFTPLLNFRQAVGHGERDASRAKRQCGRTAQSVRGLGMAAFGCARDTGSRPDQRSGSSTRIQLDPELSTAWTAPTGRMRTVLDAPFARAKLNREPCVLGGRAEIPPCCPHFYPGCAMHLQVDRSSKLPGAQIHEAPTRGPGESVFIGGSWRKEERIYHSYTELRR